LIFSNKNRQLNGLEIVFGGNCREVMLVLSVVDVNTSLDDIVTERTRRV